MTRDLYAEVTAKIVVAMKSGTAPWCREWSTTGSQIPMNAVTDRPYSGINILLYFMARDAGWPNARFLTYRQAQEAGGNVRRGEHGLKVFYFKQLVVKDRKTDEDRTIPMLREYTVFNVAQTEGLSERVMQGKGVAFRNMDQRVADADAFVKTTGADVREGAGQPCYVPSKDFISIPTFGSFITAQSYYATLMHELCHWSGAKNRLARDLSTRYASCAYALEELVAELGASFLAAEFEIDHVSRAASYLQSWVEALESNPRAIFTAASKASEACNYLRGLALQEGVAIAA